MTRNFYIFIICLLANIAYADNNSGIDFYKVGEPDIAQKLFEEQLNSSPAEKAVALYYIGEIAFDTGRPAEALDYYKQGWETNPEYAFNKVGEGKILLKTDRPAAEKAFAAAVKVNKKNAETYVAIASAYSTNGMEAEAATSLENARKLNPNAPAIFLYEGDRFVSTKQAGRCRRQIRTGDSFRSGLPDRLHPVCRSLSGCDSFSLHRNVAEGFSEPSGVPARQAHIGKYLFFAGCLYQSGRGLRPIYGRWVILRN